jgi:hypothetical protein
VQFVRRRIGHIHPYQAVVGIDPIGDLLGGHLDGASIVEVAARFDHPSIVDVSVEGASD